MRCIAAQCDSGHIEAQYKMQQMKKARYNVNADTR